MKTQPTAKPSHVFTGDLEELNTTSHGEAGAEFELLHPVTKLPLGIFIGVLGKHSQTFMDIVKDRSDKRLATQAAATRMGIDINPDSSDTILTRAIELLVACSTSWRTGDKAAIKIDGEELPFNVANATKVYNKLVWMREQVDNAIGNHALFIKA